MFFDEVNFALKVTNDCFLRCDYCMVQEEFRDTQMDTDVVTKVMHLARGFNHVKLQMMGGEPLMLPPAWFETNLERVSNIAAERKQRLELSVNTNGVKLHDKYMDVFKKYKVGVIVSFDGLGNGPKGTQRILNNIKKYNTDILMVTVTVTKDNYKDLVSVHKQLVDAGIKRYSFMYDFYASEEECQEFAASTITLQKYIAENRSKTRNLTLESLKSVKKYDSIAQIHDMQLGTNHLMNDLTIQPDGTIEPYVMHTYGYHFGNVADYDHMLDVVTQPEYLKHTKYYINSLDRIDPDVQLFKGGDYWARLVNGNYHQPNTKMIRMFRKIMQNL